MLHCPFNRVSQCQEIDDEWELCTDEGSNLSASSKLSLVSPACTLYFFII